VTEEPGQGLGHRPADDGETGRLARGSALNVGGSVVQQTAMFVTTLIIARQLGGGALGTYALAYALLTILGLLSLCGFRAAITRWVAIHLADGDPGAVRAAIQLCLAVSLGTSLVLSVVLFVFAPQIGALFDSAHMVFAVQIVALALPGTTLRDTSLAAIQGWRSQKAYTLIGAVGEPSVRLLLTAGLIAAGWGVAGPLVALLVGTWVAAAAAGIALRRRMRGLPKVVSATDVRGIFSFSMVSWVATLASSGLIWADTLLLGYFQDGAEVGLYAVATRLVNLAVFVMAPINAAFAPMFAHSHHRGDRTDMTYSYKAATGWILQLSVPAFAVLILYPSQLLSIFGESYSAGATVTVLLAVGQFVNAVTGPCGTVLSMAGKVWLNMVNNISALVVNIALNLWLIPSHGVTGAAIAWMISLTLVNVARLIEAYVVTGSWPFTPNTGATLATIVAAAAISLGVYSVLGETVGSFLISVAILLAAYLGIGRVTGVLPSVAAALGFLRGAGRRPAGTPSTSSRS